MPDDVGGTPYPDGADHGDADDASAAVVFDEAFIRAATVHEPSARERILAAVEARLDLEATRSGRAYAVADDAGADGLPEELRPYRNEDEWGAGFTLRDRRWGFGSRRSRYRGPRGHAAAVHVRWHRPVAWFLALIMGLGVVAVAVAAVYRGTGGSSPSPSRPDTGNVRTPAVESPRHPVVTAPSSVART